MVPIGAVAPLLCRPADPRITVWIGPIGSGTYDQFSSMLKSDCGHDGGEFDWRNRLGQSARVYGGRGYEAFAGTNGPWIATGSDLLNLEIEGDGTVRKLNDYTGVQLFYLIDPTDRAKPLTWDLFLYGRAHKEQRNKYRLSATDTAFLKSLLTSSLKDKVRSANILAEPITNDELANEQNTLHINLTDDGKGMKVFFTDQRPIGRGNVDTASLIAGLSKTLADGHRGLATACHDLSRDIHWSAPRTYT